MPPTNTLLNENDFLILTMIKSSSTEQTESSMQRFAKPIRSETPSFALLTSYPTYPVRIMLPTERLM